MQETAVPCPAKKRSKLSLKSMRAGRQDNILTQRLAPLFKRYASHNGKLEFKSSKIKLNLRSPTIARREGNERVLADAE